MSPSRLSVKKTEADEAVLQDVYSFINSFVIPSSTILNNSYINCYTKSMALENMQRKWDTNDYAIYLPLYLLPSDLLLFLLLLNVGHLHYWSGNTIQGDYLDECPFHALNQVDVCTWPSDCQAPSQVPSPTDYFRTKIRLLKSSKCTKFLIFMSGTCPMPHISTQPSDLLYWIQHDGL